MKRTSIYSLFLLILPLIYLGCDNEALFDQLKGSKLKMVIKGTYESNSPRDWLSTVIDDDSMIILPPSGIDSTVKPAGYDALPTVCKLDIAEIKINNDERFANYRQVYQQSMTDSDSFFNGTGVSYKCDDVRYKRCYTSLDVYMRKNAFDNAHSFIPSTGLYGSLLKSLFNEVTSPGYDFILQDVWTVYDSLRSERSSINRVYPLSIAFDTPFYYTDDDDYTLEIRLVIKNFVKRYEAIEISSSVVYSYHYFAFSDWARDVLQGDTYTGGNLIGVARWYSKNKVTTVTGSVPAGSIVIAIPAEDTIDEYTLSASDRERPTDMLLPRIAPSGGSDIISAMEYLVDLQKYNDNYSQYYTSLTTDLTVYTGAWNTYEAKLASLKIPPLAVYTSNGTFTMENVQSGRSYKFYYASASGVGMGELPSSFSGSGDTQDIDTSYAGGTFTVPAAAF